MEAAPAPEPKIEEKIHELEIKIIPASLKDFEVEQRKWFDQFEKEWLEEVAKAGKKVENS